MDVDEKMREPTAAEIGAMLSGETDMHSYEADVELDDDMMQSEDDALESEIDDAAEEGRYGIPVPGDGLGLSGNDTAQHVDDMMLDDDEPEEE